MNKKIELPKMRLPISTRGTQVHSSLKDYDRKKEDDEIQKELKESGVSENLTPDSL